MNTTHVRTLLGVEMRRVGPLALRMLGAVAAVLLIFRMAGRLDAENATAILAGSTVGYMILVPMALTRDKIDGSLEFLCYLPTTAREIVASRALAAVLMGLLGALQIAAGFALFVPPLGLVPDPAAATVGVFALAWSGLTLAALGLLALIANFRLQTLASAPLVAVGIAVILIPLLAERSGLRPGAVLQWLVRNAPHPAALALIVGILVAAVGLALLLATARGVAAFRPRPDELQL